MKRYLATLCLATTCTLVLAQSRSELMSREKIQKNKIASVSQWTHKFIKDKVDPKAM
jgi:phosphopantothenoylcysteine synthetase/decarboxylase